MAFRNPPLDQPIRTYPVPVISDQVLIEWTTSELASSTPIEPGTPHENTREFPGFKLGVQRVNPLDHNFVQRVWIKDATNQDAYNLVLKYSGDSITAPIFVRTYREPKVSHVARTKGSALQTVYKLAVTNAGSGYTPGTQPALTFSDGGGSGAAGHAVVAPDGTIAEFVLTSGGIAYTSAPTFTVAAPASDTKLEMRLSGTGNDGILPKIGTSDGKNHYQSVGGLADLAWSEFRPGAEPGVFVWLLFTDSGDSIYSRSAVATPDLATGWKNESDDTNSSALVTSTSVATGTASTQPTAAVLVEEQALQFPTDSEFYAQYFNVVRVYETLPGPYIPFTRYDENLGPIQGRRRAVLNSGQVTTLGATSKKTYEGRDGSSIVSWEIEENWSDGTGSAGNPVYPILKTNLYDNDRGAVAQTSQIVADTTSVGSLVVSSGTATQIRHEAYQDNPNLRKKIIEVWTVPGPLQTSTEFEKDGVRKVVTRQMVDKDNVLTTETLATGTLTRKFAERLNAKLAFQIIETITVISGDLLDLPTYTKSILNLIPEIFRALIPLRTSSRIIEGSADDDPALGTGEFEHSERQLTPLYKEVRSTVLDDIGTLPITVDGMKETNAQKQVVTVSMKLCLDSTTPTAPTALIDIDFKKLGNGLAIEITRTIPGVFSAAEFAVKSPSYPSEYVTGETTAASDTAGTASAPTAPAGGSAVEQQRDVFVKRTTTTTPTTSSPVTEVVTNEKKQKVTIVRTLGGTAVSPSATVDVEQRVLPGGRTEGITKTVPGVFDKDTRSIEIPDVTPDWAKALLPTTNVSTEAAATSVSDPTLSTGQLRKEVRRTTEQTVETTTTARSLASLPKSRTNKRLTTEFGGGAVDEVETVASGSQSISAGGLLVLDSEMQVLGDGTSVLRTSIQSDGSWPVLTDYDIDPQTGQTILTTYQVVSAGSATTATSVAGVVTRYKHIDKWRSLKIVTTYSTPADYDEQRFGAHEFPALCDGNYTWSASCGAFAPETRGAFSAMVRMRTTISHSTTKQTIDGLTLLPKQLILGRGWQLPAVLIDNNTFVATGECVATVPFFGSDPDYSTYVGAIQGTESLITGESVRTQSGLYRNTRVYVFML